MDLNRQSKDTAEGISVTQADIQKIERLYGLSLSYYFDDHCPDGHITDALKSMLARGSLKFSRQENADLSDRNEDRKLGEELNQVWWLIAVNPNTPSSVLDDMANVASSRILERIAENPRTTSETLARLAFDPCSDVRAAVAENANTPVETITMLVSDENPDVRYRLAENHASPVDILSILSDDENPYVCHRARKTLSRVNLQEPLVGNFERGEDQQRTRRYLAF